MYVKKPILVISHKNCLDGFASATVAWMALGDSASYRFMDFRDPLPTDLAQFDMVYVLDFSFSRVFLEDQRKLGVQWLILDHHAGVQPELAGLEYANFDIQKSGASMAWAHFFPGEAEPLFIQYVEDYDLWRKVLPGCDAYKEYMANVIPRTFESWRNTLFAHTYPHAVESAISTGLALQEKTKNESSQLCEQARPCLINGEVGLAVNGPAFLANDVGATLYADQANYVLIWFMTGAGQIKCSFRSREGYSVLPLAQAFGGNGHPCSAGCTVSVTDLLGWLPGTNQ